VIQYPDRQSASIRIDLSTEPFNVGGGLARVRAGLNRAVTAAATSLVRHHFRELVRTNCNEYGLPPAFWPRMIRETSGQATTRGGEVRLPREVAHRYLGGVIEPKNGARALTIPVIAAAYHQRARDISGLRYYPADPRTDGGYVGFLGRPSESGEGPEIYYNLVRRARQDGQKFVLPKPEELETAVRAAIKRFTAKLH